MNQRKESNVKMMHWQLRTPKRQNDSEQGQPMSSRVSEWSWSVLKPSLYVRHLMVKQICSHLPGGALPGADALPQAMPVRAATQPQPRVVHAVGLLHPHRTPDQHLAVFGNAVKCGNTLALSSMKGCTPWNSACTSAEHSQLCSGSSTRTNIRRSKEARGQRRKWRQERKVDAGTHLVSRLQHSHLGAVRPTAEVGAPRAGGGQLRGMPRGQPRLGRLPALKQCVLRRTEGR